MNYMLLTEYVSYPKVQAWKQNTAISTIGPFFVAYQNLPGRCLVCKHGSHVINIPKADWSGVKNKQLTAMPC